MRAVEWIAERTRAVALVGLVLLAVLLVVHEAAPARDVAGRGPSPVEARSTAGFRSRSALDEHFRKHARDIGSGSKADYLRRAQELRDRDPGEQVLEARRADGVVTRFDRTTGAFIAFEPDGVIRTFFRPNDGEAYFWRQSRRRQTR